MSLISGRHDGRQVIFNVAVLGAAFEAADAFSGQEEAIARVLSEPVKALVDTGATSTSISLETAKRLQLHPVGKRDVMTANGSRRSRIYNFQIAMISSPILQDESERPQFFVLPNAVSGTELNPSAFRFDILLGMDVISQGNLAIRRNGTFSFEF